MGKFFCLANCPWGVSPSRANLYFYSDAQVCSFCESLQFPSMFIHRHCSIIYLRLSHGTTATRVFRIPRSRVQCTPLSLRGKPGRKACASEACCSAPPCGWRMEMLPAPEKKPVAANRATWTTERPHDQISQQIFFVLFWKSQEKRTLEKASWQICGARKPQP